MQLQTGRQDPRWGGCRDSPCHGPSSKKSSVSCSLFSSLMASEAIVGLLLRCTEGYLVNLLLF